MISAGDITKELLVSTPTGVYIQILRKEDTHMLRHIWVTPKQFCELTKLSMDEMNSIADEYGFVTKEENGQLYLDLMDFGYVYKTVHMIKRVDLSKRYESFTEDDLSA